MHDICPHFGSCGGCSRQDVDYAQQLKDKDEWVRSFLSDVPTELFLPILPSPEKIFYRNKMEYSFGNEVDIQIFNAPRLPAGQKKFSTPGSVFAATAERHQIHLGLHPRKRFALVMPTPECQLMSVESQKILRTVSEWANHFQVPVFTRKSGLGQLRHLVIREGKNTGERMVKLVAKSETDHVDALAEALKQSGVVITTFLWAIHDGLSDVAHGNENKIFWGNGTIREKIGQVEVKVTSSSFLQTNTRAAEQMLDVLRSWIPDEPTKIVDLYCGSGTIGLNLAKGCSLVGIETNPSAVAEAKATAYENGFMNAHFIQGQVEKLINTEPLLNLDEKSLVVVDPPRPGLHPVVSESLLQWQSPVLFYVSCNPESLSRDLRVLSARYRIRAIQPMDFFPHTDHVETAVHLSSR